MESFSKDDVALVPDSDFNFNARVIGGARKTQEERKSTTWLRWMTIAFILTTIIFAILFVTCFILLARKSSGQPGSMGDHSTSDNLNATFSKELDILRGEIVSLKSSRSAQVEKKDEAMTIDSMIVRKLAKLSGWYSSNLTNGVFYQLFASAKSWDAAEAQCQIRGTRLAVSGMRDADTRRDIVKNVVSGSGMHVWIGLEEPEDNGAWQWIDGVASNVTDPYWDSGQPESYPGRRDCGNLERGKKWKIHDRPCSQKMYFLCEL